MRAREILAIDCEMTGRITGELVAVKFINKQSFREIDDADRVFVEIQARRIHCFYIPSPLGHLPQTQVNGPLIMMSSAMGARSWHLATGGLLTRMVPDELAVTLGGTIFAAFSDSRFLRARRYATSRTNM